MPTQELVYLDLDHYSTVVKMDRSPLVVNLNIDHYEYFYPDGFDP